MAQLRKGGGCILAPTTKDSSSQNLSDTTVELGNCWRTDNIYPTPRASRYYTACRTIHAPQIQPVSKTTPAWIELCPYAALTIPHCTGFEAESRERERLPIMGSSSPFLLLVWASACLLLPHGSGAQGALLAPLVRQVRTSRLPFPVTDTHTVYHVPDALLHKPSHNTLDHEGKGGVACRRRTTMRWSPTLEWVHSLTKQTRQVWRQTACLRPSPPPSCFSHSFVVQATRHC